MNLIENYNKALQELYDHVGFIPDWVTYPIDDCTQMYWSTDGKTVRFAKTLEIYNDESEEYYLDDVYTQRFYRKHIYRGTDLTMIFCDPQVDGMKYFRIFDNTKEQKS